ncbi:MAG: 2-phospho-L-lactate transferase [Pseudomonadota bacterium]
MIRVTLIAGGVGGAKMAEGLQALEDVALTVIGNIADDDDFHGLWVSPDIDTMLYTLSGRINRAQGWGVEDEGRRALETLAELGAPTWMFLGDRDFGLHIYRSQRLARGDRPSLVTADIAERFGVRAKIVLPSDDRVQTRVRTAEGWLSFQEYFVRERCTPEVLELRYEGMEAARATQEARDAIAGADVIIIAPSNPLVSIAPITGIAGITEALKAARAPLLAVSPLIAGRVVKGPADKMMASLGLRADALGVAEGYAGLAQHMVIDTQDRALSPAIRALGLTPHATDILMPDLAAKTRLARQALSFARARPAGQAA